MADPEAVTHPAFGAQLFAKRAPALIALMRSRGLRLAFLVVVLALLAVALSAQAGTLWTQVQRLTAPVVLLAVCRQSGRAHMQHDRVAVPAC